MSQLNIGRGLKALGSVFLFIVVLLVGMVAWVRAAFWLMENGHEVIGLLLQPISVILYVMLGYVFYKGATSGEPEPKEKL